MNATQKPAHLEGTTYNIKLDTGETGPEGKKVWAFIGKAFVRADGAASGRRPSAGRAARA